MDANTVYEMVMGTITEDEVSEGYAKIQDEFLIKSSKSPASIAKSNKQWVGTCLYQEACKRLLINCGAVIWL